MNNKLFVENSIQELLETGRIREVKEKPWVVNPLTVSEKGDKKRLILDLSHVNFHVFKNNIKFEDWKVMLQFLKKGDYMFKFDITQGYHHIDIFEEHQQFFGFAWNFNGKIRYFVFTVLAFGLTSGPFIFTKLMRVLIKYWRTYGIKIVCFLDDGLGGGKTSELTYNDSNFVRKSLMYAGFVINEEKSVWRPSQNITWLGVNLNSESGCFTISKSRVDSILQTIGQMIKDFPYTTARKIAELCGKIVSTKFVLGNVVQLKTRRLHNIIASRQSWDGRININEFWYEIEEIYFWKENFKRYNFRWLSSQYIPPIKAYSDASSTGIAAHFKLNGVTKIASKNLTCEDISRSSTWRELFAIEHALLSFNKFSANKSVL